jgi:hypothetical protein
MNRQDKEEDSHSSSASKQVSFSDIVEEIYVDYSTYLYNDECDTEMDFSELSSEPLESYFGDSLQAFTKLSEYDNYCDESSISEESAHETGVIQQVPPANIDSVDDGDDDDLRKNEEPTGFFIGLLEVFSVLSLCTRGFGWLGRLCIPRSPNPIDEDDVLAAVGIAKGGGKLAAVGAAGGFSGTTNTGAVVIS